MFINGTPTYSRNGEKQSTGLLSGRVARDGELLTTQSGKEIGFASVPAYSKQDGTTVWLTVKGWGHWARVVASARKGDSLFAVGRIDSREYNGKTYNDLVADYVFVSRASDPAPAPAPAARPGVNVSAADFAEIDEEDGELPF